MVAILRFAGDRRGTVSIITAAFCAMMAIGSTFAVQSASLYVVKLRSQRVADLASLATTLLNSPVQGGQVTPLAAATAVNIAVINGFAASAVSTAAGNNNGLGTVSTTVAGSTTLLFAALLGGKSNASVSAMATVQLANPYPNCITSLTNGLAISATVSGTSCGIASQSSLTLAGATIDVGSVTTSLSKTAEASYASGYQSLTPTLSAFTYNATTSDAIASTAAVAAITQHLAALGTWPYGSSSPVSFTSGAAPTGTTNIAAAGTYPYTTSYGTVTLDNASITFSGYGSADPTCLYPTTISGAMVFNGTNTITLGSGCYIVAGNVQLQTGSTTFQNASGAVVTIVFDQSIANESAGTLTLGDGTYSFGGDIQNQQGGAITIGNGQMVFAGNISNNFGSMTFGNGPFYVNGGSISQNGGMMQFGAGPFYIWGGSITNMTYGTYKFGAGPFYVHGGSLINGTTSGNCPFMTFGNGGFYIDGGSVTTAACATTQFGAGNMDFYAGGSMTLNGTSVIGAGGSSSAGASMLAFEGGGGFTLASGTLAATGVTLALDSGAVALEGAGSIVLTAPTGAEPSYGYQNILIVDQTGTVTFDQPSGPLGTFSGVVYAPGNTATLEGGGTASVMSGGCFGIAARTVAISGSLTTDIAPCSGLAEPSSTSVSSMLQ